MTHMLDSGTRTARKDHACSCCSKPIPKGTKYHFQACVMDGSAFTWRTHSETGHCGTEIVEDSDDGTFCEVCSGEI